MCSYQLNIQMLFTAQSNSQWTWLLGFMKTRDVEQLLIHDCLDHKLSPKLSTTRFCQLVSYWASLRKMKRRANVADPHPISGVQHVHILFDWSIIENNLKKEEQ
jgi:hypothetical protein